MNQKEVCQKYKVSPAYCAANEKLGIAIRTVGQLPINGLRHQPESGTCGWYIWCGEELSESPDFFEPLHISHIKEYLPEVEPYLALPAGYRFLVSGQYEDVWYDPSLIRM